MASALFGTENVKLKASTGMRAEEENEYERNWSIMIWFCGLSRGVIRNDTFGAEPNLL